MAHTGTARMTLAGALRSEFMRLRRSALLPLHLALGLALGAGAGAYFAWSSWDPMLGADAFFQLLGAGAPLLVGIACGLSLDAEREAGAYANLLGVASRRRAFAAKVAALLALGLLAGLLAGAVFCALLAVAGKPGPSAGICLAAVLGVGAGSVLLYALSFAVALSFGRNAAIGIGALGFVVALASLGGLGNGLVTGTLSGTAAATAAALIPFAWPSRLASLTVELAIAASPAGSAELAASVLQALVRVAGVSLVVTTAFCALGLALANRHEDRRRTGD